jgi:tripartite-type tricarboxylate transporter receptor subunit TctC
MPSRRCKENSMTHRLVRIAAVALVTLAFLGAATASAQTYPAKTIRIVVPFAPGGPNDILARLIAPRLTDAWGQPVIVDNRPGGGTVIGTDLVAKAPPDGYTLLVVSTTTATNPSLVRKLPYDTLRDLQPVILLAASPNVLVVHPSLPAKSVSDLVKIAKARPGQVAFGSGGNGTSTHLAGEILRLNAGVDMVHVPYKGASPSTFALLSGEVSWMFGSILPLLPHLQSGRLRAIAVSSTRRVAALPEVPPVAETFPGFEASPWHGISAPAGTPREIVMKLNQEIARIMNVRETRERLAREGTEVLTNTSEQFEAFVKAEIEKFAKVIKAAGIQAQ